MSQYQDTYFVFIYLNLIIHFAAPKGMSRYQETYFVFHLTPQQAQDIAMSRDFRPSAKWEYTVQVQLRYTASSHYRLQDI